jgi:hypothetical protein
VIATHLTTSDAELMRNLGLLSFHVKQSWRNLQHALALHFMHYNFWACSQDAWHDPGDGGRADHPWDIAEIASLINR